MRINDEKIRGQVELILFTIIVIWGINTPVMKIGLMELPPFIYNAVRLALTAVLSCTALLLSGTFRRVPWQDMRLILLISIVGVFLNQVFVLYGLSHTTAGNASLVLATLPVEVALINRLLKLEPVSRRMVAGIITGLLGVFLIVLGSGKELSLSGPHLVGAMLLLAGQFAYAYYTVFFGQLINKYSIYQIIASVMTINAALFCLIALPDLTRLAWADISPAAWYSILFSGTFALFMANFVWIWAVGVLGTTKASLYQYLCPVFSIAFAWVYLNETFGAIQFIGAAVTFLGIYLTRNNGQQQPYSIQGPRRS